MRAGPLRMDLQLPASATRLLEPFLHNTVTLHAVCPDDRALEKLEPFSAQHWHPAYGHRRALRDGLRVLRRGDPPLSGLRRSCPLAALAP